MADSTPIKQGDDFADTPYGWAKRWQVELAAAKKVVESFHRQGDKIVKRFLDDRRDSTTGISDTRLNLFTGNVQTLRSILYGKVPSVDVDRRFSDADDDEARVASEILQRVLNNDIEDPEDSYTRTLLYCLDDRLLVGMGTARVRYEAEFEEEEVPAVTQPDPVTGEMVELAPAYTQEVKTDEDCETDYVYWKDFLWSPARIWSEVRWVAFRSYLTLDQGKERFGDVFENVPTKGPKKGSTSDQSQKDPWERAEVWEIWCKEHEAVYWYVEGFDQTLDIKDDPLELEGFFPCPMPMFANLTSSGLLPRPEFVIAQDLYNEIDLLETRIVMLTKACKLVGVYDKSADGVKRLLQEGVENDLIPVDNWAMFAEKGGIKGTIDWLPIEQVANTIQVLTGIRDNTISMLYQVTGMSDIMRGGAMEGGATATEQSIKARFASVRIQAMQDEFARFATDLQRLRASVIVKHYDDQTLIKQSNIDRTPDAQWAQQAIELLRSDFAEYRISIKSENLSVQEYAAMKQERTDALGALSNFIPRMVEASQAIPGSLPYLLEIMKWGLQGFRGIKTIEGVLDQAIEAVKQQGPPEPQGPSPEEQAKAQAEQVKAQADVQKSQLGVQREQVNLQTAQVQAASEVQKAQAKQSQAERDAAEATGLPYIGPR